MQAPSPYPDNPYDQPGMFRNELFLEEQQMNERRKCTVLNTPWYMNKNKSGEEANESG
jgi:hypothetical protein